MEYFAGQSVDNLRKLESDLLEQIKKFQGMGLNLNMARGKPCKEQLDISNAVINGDIDFSINIDYRNYGLLDGIPEAKELFREILEVSSDEIIIGGNSSLNMMYDAITRNMLLGAIDSDIPWSKESKIKFLTPVPGYDRHFAICEQLGIEMINIDMDKNGPDMDQVEALVSEDASIKGIWCVPKYSNPSGITYSDDVVKRLANMETKAKDFKIFWDNAYAIHHLTETPDEVLNILDECKLAGNNNRVYMFASTSKVTFPGSGVAMLGASKDNIDYIKGQIGIQSIGPDKMNQLMHVEFFKNFDGIKEHMIKHAEIIGPKFEKVLKLLNVHLDGKNIACWNEPKGGYFISLDVLDGCAKEIVGLCLDCGVTLTSAGATYPYGKDPRDSNIRIAPTFPPMEELEQAIEILCTCVEYVCVKKVLAMKKQLV